MLLVDFLLFMMTIYLCLKIIQIYASRVILLIVPIMIFLQEIISIIYLNSGVYVSELGRTTYYVGKSTPLFILYVNIFLLFLVYYGKKSLLRIKKTEIINTNNLSVLVCYASLFLTLVLALYTIFDMFFSGIPIISTFITHYNYYTLYSRLPFASTVNNLLGISMYFLGYSYVHIKKRYFRVLCLFCVLGTMVVRLMMGYKMFGLIDIPLNFISVAVLLSKVDFKNFKQLIKIRYILILGGIFAGILMLFLVSVISSGMEKDVLSAFRFFINRAFGLGNHLWWAAEADDISGNDLFGHNLLREFGAIFTGKNQYDINTGMYYLMKKYGDSYIVGIDIKNNIRYAATFITTSVYNFGYIFAIIPIMMNARIMVWFVNMIELAVKKDRFFQFLLLCKIWGTFLTFIIATGTMTEWLNPENYCYFLGYCFLRFYIKRRFDIRVIKKGE